MRGSPAYATQAARVQHELSTAGAWTHTDSNEGIEDGLVLLLLPGQLLWLLSLLCMLRELGEAQRPVVLADALAEVRLQVALVTVLQHRVKLTVLDQLSGAAQTACVAVHAIDVADKQVLHVGRLAAHLRIEIKAARLQPALSDH